jgi:hypothetical protein
MHRSRAVAALKPLGAPRPTCPRFTALIGALLFLDRAGSMGLYQEQSAHNTNRFYAVGTSSSVVRSGGHCMHLKPSIQAPWGHPCSARHENFVASSRSTFSSALWPTSRGSCDSCRAQQRQPWTRRSMAMIGDFLSRAAAGLPKPPSPISLIRRMSPPGDKQCHEVTTATSGGIEVRIERPTMNR